jgi:integrase
VADAIRRLCRAAGVHGRVTPHSFRKGFGRACADRGWGPHELAAMLGHSSPAVTWRVYVEQPSEADLLARCEAFAAAGR